MDREKIYQWINELSSPETRENALLELSKKRESVPDLAPMLWHSCGTIAALLQVSTEQHNPGKPKLNFMLQCCFCVCLQEIVNIYPSINPPTLTAHQSNRVCNALALLQCVASHPETRYITVNALTFMNSSMTKIWSFTGRLFWRHTSHSSSIHSCIQ